MPQKKCAKCQRWSNSPDGLCNICLIESFGIPIEHEDAPDLHTFSYVSVNELATWLRKNKRKKHSPEVAKEYKPEIDPFLKGIMERGEEKL